jgi:hypothetical protein
MDNLSLMQRVKRYFKSMFGGPEGLLMSLDEHLA